MRRSFRLVEGFWDGEPKKKKIGLVGLILNHRSILHVMTAVAAAAESIWLQTRLSTSYARTRLLTSFGVVLFEELRKYCPQLFQVAYLVFAGRGSWGGDALFDEVGYCPPQLLRLFAVVVRVV